MTTTAKTWKDEVLRKLIEVLQIDDVETLTRVVWYLGEEDRLNEDDTEIPSGWKVLRATIDLNPVFKSYAERLAEVTKKPENEQAYRRDMKILYDRMNDVTAEDEDNDTPTESSEENDNSCGGFLVVHSSRRNTDHAGPDENKNNECPGKSWAMIGFSHVWDLIQVTSQHAIIQMIPPLIINRQVLFFIDEAINLVHTAGTTTIMTGLAGIILTYEAVRNLYRWWGYDISGWRCTKNIIDATCAVGGGLAGGVAGAAAGSFAGPFGTVAGCVIGGIFSSHMMSALCSKLTEALFGIPKDEALEKAYAFIGVKMSASNEEVNFAYKKLCLRHHPDKGGKGEDFVALQVHMGVIKLARGELL